MSRTESAVERSAPGKQTNSPVDPIREAFVSFGRSDFDEMGIESMVSVWEAAGLEHVEKIACRCDGAVVQVEVAESMEHSRLASLDPVQRFARVTDRGGTFLYVVEFSTPWYPGNVTAGTDDLVAYEVDLSAHGVTVSLVGPQTAIADIVDELERAGMTPDLLKIGPYEGRERPLDGLTERQREVIHTAHDLGYYEVPRDATLEDVAAEFDIDASTVTEHLQRAERNLLTGHPAFR